MPKTCSGVGCQNHNMMLKKFSFHKFPKDEVRMKFWLAALKRDKPDGSPWIPTKNSVICNEHFITRKPHESMQHPDYVPSIFIHKSATKTVQEKQIARYNRQNHTKRTILSQNSDSNEKRGKLSSTCSHTDPASNSCTETFHNTPQANCPTTENLENIPPHLDIDCTDSTSDTMPAVRTDKDEVTPTERQMVYQEMDNLRREKAELKDETEKLKADIKSLRFKAESVENNGSKSQFYTGLRWDVFMATFTFLKVFMRPTPLVRRLLLHDQFFVTLIKLRLDLPFDLMANQCAVPSSTLHDMCWRWIELMSKKLDFFIHWPDHEIISKTLPGVFKAKFPHLTSIVDCFEIFIDRPKNLQARVKCYSNYKKHSTVKVFIVCTPVGSVSYLSTVWGGRVSDVELVRASGFIDTTYHLPGDQILADRGFTLEDDFATACSAEFIIPAFTKGKKQLSAKDVERSRKIASIRIHIERVIGLMKNRYKILQGTLPINCIKSLRDEAADENIARIDKLVRLCGALTNLGEGIVYDEDVKQS